MTQKDIDEIIIKVKEYLKDIHAFEINYYTFCDDIRINGYDGLLLKLRCTFNIINNNNTFNSFSITLTPPKITSEIILDTIKRALKAYYKYNIDDELQRIITLKNNINTLKKLL